MITKFTTYINESRMSIDNLEMLNPDELGKLLRSEASKTSPDFQHIQDILDVGCPIDARDKYGGTALHRAAGDEDPDVLLFLISNGADIEAMDNEDQTAWDCANNEISNMFPELNPNR